MSNIIEYVIDCFPSTMIFATIIYIVVTGELMGFVFRNIEFSGFLIASLIMYYIIRRINSRRKDY